MPNPTIDPAWFSIGAVVISVVAVLLILTGYAIGLAAIRQTNWHKLRAAFWQTTAISVLGAAIVLFFYSELAGLIVGIGGILLALSLLPLAAVRRHRLAATDNTSGGAGERP